MSAKIIVDSNKCQIVDEEDVELIRKIDRALSFDVPTAKYSRAHKGFINNEGKAVTWDGCEHLLSSELEFAPGLLARVKNIYKSFDQHIEIVDVRPTESPRKFIDISKKLTELGKIPYDYQLDTAKTACQNSRGIIRIATGGGKSLIAAIIAANLGKSTIIYVIGKDLLYQIHNLFSSIFDCKIGIIGDGHCEISDINVASVWSIGNALSLKKIKAEDEGDEQAVPSNKHRQIKNLIKNSKVHIFDECHLAACDTIQGIAQKLNPEHVYGMSASPIRDDNADLLIENYLGNIIVNISARSLIDQGYLVPPLIRFLSVPKYEGSRGAYKTIYNHYIVKNPDRNGMVVKGAEKLVEQGFRTLVLFHNLKHGQILHDELKGRISCGFLSGQDDNMARQKVKENLEAGKIDCVIASKIFDIGVDLPSLSGLVVAGAGKSSVRALQRIGRVIRKYPAKTQAVVIEFADQAPFLFGHAQKRKQIYDTEEFKVQWPGEKQK